MFKIESYVTPLILSYVDKYIKNLRPEDSQVSLWGGEAVFTNLDLRLGVLEEEFQLPFTFVNGHIHELKILVPWTRIGTEPIVVTVNTLECVLKLDGGESVRSSSLARQGTKIEEASPPGYIQSLALKIVQNIAVVFNNVILKYVEDDMVLSLNVRSFKWSSCDANWSPAFVDIGSSPDWQLRKLATLNDLTICLDQRNACGKIEYYQDPLVYKCTLDCRASIFFEDYPRKGLQKIKATQFSIHCSSLNVSLTDKQLPMCYRLLNLACAVSDEPTSSHAGSTHAIEEEGNLIQEDGYDGWTSWAWNMIPSLIGDEYEDSEAAFTSADVPNVSIMGFYFDSASITVKLMELKKEQKPRVSFTPFAGFDFIGCFFEYLQDGVNSNSRFGVGQGVLKPLGNCPCGAEDGAEEYYLTCGRTPDDPGVHLKGSLFDPGSKIGGICETLEEHLESHSELDMMNRSPAISGDLIAFPNRGSWLRMFVGSVEFSVDSGCVHRTELIYSSTFDGTCEDSSLLPCNFANADGEEEEVALFKHYRIVILGPVGKFFPFTHGKMKKSKKRKISCVDTSTLPSFDIGCRHVEITRKKPLLLLQHQPNYDEVRMMIQAVRGAVVDKHQSSLVLHPSDLVLTSSTFVAGGQATVAKSIDGFNVENFKMQASVQQIQWLANLAQSLFYRNRMLTDHGPSPGGVQVGLNLWGLLMTQGTSEDFSGHQVSLRKMLVTASKPANNGTATVLQLLEAGETNGEFFRAVFQLPTDSSHPKVPLILALEALPFVIRFDTDVIVPELTKEISSLTKKTKKVKEVGGKGSEASVLGSSTAGWSESQAQQEKEVKWDWFGVLRTATVSVSLAGGKILVSQADPLLETSFSFPEVAIATHQTKSDLAKRLPSFLPILGSFDGQLLDAEKFPVSVKLSGLTVNEGTNPIIVGIGAEGSLVPTARGNGFCLHMDMTPFSGICSKQQFTLLSHQATSLMNCASSVMSMLPSAPKTTRVVPKETPNVKKDLPEPSLRDSGQWTSASKVEGSQCSSSSPLRIGETSTADTIPSLWLQWTCPKLSFAFDTFSIEADELGASMDWQKLFYKLKLKVVSFNVLRNGSVVIASSETHQLPRDLAFVASGGKEARMISKFYSSSTPHPFLQLTMTVVQASSVQEKFGIKQKEELLKRGWLSPAVESIVEFDVNLQPFDVVFHSSWLEKLRQFVPSGEKAEKTVPGAGVGDLPLVYFQSGAARVFLLRENGQYFLFNLDSVKVQTGFDDSFSRTVLHEESYRVAEKTGILAVPGSVVESRVYSLSIQGVSLTKGTSFHDLEQQVKKQRKRAASQDLRTMSENPALEWNLLVSTDPEPKTASPVPLKAIIEPFDIKASFAPACFAPGVGVVLPVSAEIATAGSLTVKLWPEDAQDALTFFTSESSEEKESQTLPMEAFVTCKAFEVNIFDSNDLQLGNMKFVDPYATLQDFPLRKRKLKASFYDFSCSGLGKQLVCTKTGDPDARTGVYPSVFTATFVGQEKIEVEVGRPVKISAHLPTVEKVKKKVDEAFGFLLESGDRSTKKEAGFTPIEATCTQVVLEVANEAGNAVFGEISEGNLSLSGDLELSARFGDFEITCRDVKGEKLQLVSPVSFTIAALIDENSKKAKLEADLVKVHLGPPQVACALDVLEDLKRFSAGDEGRGVVVEVLSRRGVLESSNDFKSGVLALVANQAPVAGQMAVDELRGTLTWRYFEARAVSRLLVAPVPFVATSFPADEDEEDTLTCRLEYFSWLTSSFNTLTTFKLSESTFQEIPLPEVCIPLHGQPLAPVADIWRISIGYRSTDLNEQDQRLLISPLALLASVGLDSISMPELSPKSELGVKISCLTIENEVHRTSATFPQHVQTNILPEVQVWSVLEVTNFTSTFTERPEWFTLDFLAGIEARLTKTSHLTEHWVARLPNTASSIFAFPSSNLLDVKVKVHDAALRWSTALNEEIERSLKFWRQKEEISCWKYLISNSTSSLLRFGQTGTNEELSLNPGEIVPFAWKSNNGERTVKVKLGSVWSSPLELKIGQTFLPVGKRTILAVIKQSGNVFRVDFHGLLAIVNLNPFGIHVNISGESILVDSSKTVTVVDNPEPIRVVSVGKAVLDCTKSDQTIISTPETGNLRCKTFKTNDRRTILVLSPIYAVRSFMPVPLEALVVTPGLGRLKSTQLLPPFELEREEKVDLVDLVCPGGPDLSHQLSFKAGHEEWAASVPLSPGMVDQVPSADEDGEFKLSFDEIMSTFEPVKRPMSGKFDGNVVVQPKVHLKVTYDRLSSLLDTLVLELRPDLILVNQLPCDFEIISSFGCQRWGGATVSITPKYEEPFDLHILDTTEVMSDVKKSIELDWLEPRMAAGQLPMSPSSPSLRDAADEVKLQMTDQVILSMSRIGKNGSPETVEAVLSSRKENGVRIVSVTPRWFFVNCGAVPLKMACSVNHDHPNWLELPPNSTDKPVPVCSWSCGSSSETPKLLLQDELGKISEIELSQKETRKHVVLGSSLLTIATTCGPKGEIYVAFDDEPHPALIVHNLVAQEELKFAGILSESRKGFQLSQIVDLLPGTSTPYFLSNEDAEFGPKSTIQRPPSYKFVISGPEEDSEWVEFTLSEGVTFLKVTPTVDVQVNVESCGFTKHVLLLPVHRIRASNIRNLIGKSSQEERVEHSKPEQEELKLDFGGKRRWTTTGDVGISRVSLSLVDDFTDQWRAVDVFSLVVLDPRVAWRPQFDYTKSLKVLGDNPREFLEVECSAKDVHFENLEPFDFPVVLQKREEGRDEHLVVVQATFEPTLDKLVCRRILVAVQPLCANLEDAMWRKLGLLLGHLLSFNLGQPQNSIVPSSIFGMLRPITFEEFEIAPLTVEVSVHASVKLYLSINQSQLRFPVFRRENLKCTVFKLGQEVSRHFLVGALLRAGFVLGSLDILGSPSVFVREVTTGVKDWVTLPYQGIFGGPQEFLRGVSCGTRSLVQHLTSGTLLSLTNMAGSVAHNLEALSLDDEHRQRALESRRTARNAGLVGGFQSGLSEFGMSLLGAIGGIAHHPLEAAMRESTQLSSTSVVAGFGKGLVGAVTKPLGGAAHLLASTGHGLLQAAGWGPKVKCFSEKSVINEEDTRHGLLWANWKLNLQWAHPGLLVEATQVQRLAEEVVYIEVSLLVAEQKLVVIKEETTELLEGLEVVSVEDPTLVGFCYQEKTRDEEVKELMEIKQRVEAYVMSSGGFRKSVKKLEEEELEDGAHWYFHVAPRMKPLILAFLRKRDQGCYF